jgi:septum formation protein
MRPEVVPVWLAEKKAIESGGDKRNTLVLSADTIVLLEDKILGKPSSRDEAVEMLEKLSGTVHEVITGVCILLNDERYIFSDLSMVYFRPLLRSEILAYVAEGSPMDKAGAYGIQDWLGMVAVEKVVGSYFNVMGLPIHKVYAYLSRYSLSE